MMIILQLIGALAVTFAAALFAFASWVLVWERSERRRMERMERRGDLADAAWNRAMHAAADEGVRKLAEDRAMGIYHRLPRERKGRVQ